MQVDIMIKVNIVPYKQIMCYLFWLDFFSPPPPLFVQFQSIVLKEHSYGYAERRDRSISYTLCYIFFLPLLFYPFLVLSFIPFLYFFLFLSFFHAFSFSPLLFLSLFPFPSVFPSDCIPVTIIYTFYLLFYVYTPFNEIMYIRVS